jgi:hypothetical protein
VGEWAADEAMAVLARKGKAWDIGTRWELIERCATSTFAELESCELKQRP